ncbi:MAG: glycosyltransferase family 2 protein [Pseudomonadota bacterium]
MEIVVPVYNAPAELARCLQALEAYTPPAQPILLIDDASPDHAVRPLLDAFVDRPERRLLRHAENRGFVRTANAGFEATTADVLLLNSDAIVTPGAVEALARALAADATIATATPFSNNAEICSFPDFCRPCPLPSAPEAIARAVARTAVPHYPELPTGVGFCMAVSRRALDALGGFDAETFGAGYGEENDFCRRAAAAGWRNVLCDDAYVAHVGHASFRDTPWRPGGEAMQRLLAKHPDYEQVVHDFIAADPLAAIRQAIIDAMTPTERDAAGLQDLD